MREILRPGAGITAAYRKQITRDLLDALPGHRKVISLMGQDISPRNIFRHYQDEFRKNLMRTPYTMEHIINLFVNFKEKVFDETDTPLHGASLNSHRQALDNIFNLEKNEVNEIIYSAIEEYPQDIELFVNNLP